MFVCVVLLSQSNSRYLDYPLWDVYTQEFKKNTYISKEKRITKF